MKVQAPNWPTRISPRALGITLGVLGGLGSLYAVGGLGMVEVHHLLFAKGGKTPHGMMAMHEAMRSLYWLHLPIWLAGGIALIVAGVRLHAMRPGSIGLARALSVAAIVAFAAYLAHSMIVVMPVFRREMGTFRGMEYVQDAIMWFSFIASTLVIVMPFVVVLFGLRTRRSVAPAARGVSGNPLKKCS